MHKIKLPPFSMTWHRPSLAEAFAITPVPVAQDTNSERFISHYPPWKLGTELPMPPQAFGAFGGTVYGQAALAAARTHEKRTSNESDKDAHMGIFVSITRESLINNVSQWLVYPRSLHTAGNPRPPICPRCDSYTKRPILCRVFNLNSTIDATI